MSSQEFCIKQMRTVIWVVIVQFANDSRCNCGTAFAIDGKLITSGHLIENQKDANNLEVKIMARQLDEQNFNHVMLIDFPRPRWDMVMLKFKDGLPRNFTNGKLADNGNIGVQERVCLIGCPNGNPGAFLSGPVLYPCRDDAKVPEYSNAAKMGNFKPSIERATRPYRVLGDSRRTKFFKVKNYDRQPFLPIIQMDLNSQHGCSGSPVFKRNGDIVGMLNWGADHDSDIGYSMAVHLSVLKAFLKAAQERQHEAEGS